MPRTRGPVPSGFGDRSRLLLLEGAALFCPIEGVLQTELHAASHATLYARSHREGGKPLSLVKPPPKKPKSASLQVRIDEEVRQKLVLYAQFIESTPSYVVAEALKLLFSRDAEFKRWLGQHTNSSLVSESNPELKGEESLVDPFKLA